jgi:hypothetical protein
VFVSVEGGLREDAGAAKGVDLLSDKAYSLEFIEVDTCLWRIIEN